MSEAEDVGYRQEVLWDAGALPAEDRGQSREEQFDSVVFYDLETTGRNPRDCRMTQFAAVRATRNLATVLEREQFHVRLDEDVVPSPEALLISQKELGRLQSEGIPEPEAAKRIAQFLNRPRTLRCGWNNIRYDDELVRHVRWRSLLPPYERESTQGNARMDVQTLYRAASVLAPELLAEWPLGQRGRESYGLGRIAGAAGVTASSELHDAAADTDVTLQLARKLRAEAQPVWEYGIECATRTRVEPSEFQRPERGRAEVWLWAEHGLARGPRGCRIVVPLGANGDTWATHVVDVARKEGPEVLLRGGEETLLRMAERDGNGRRRRTLPLALVKRSGAPFLWKLPGPSDGGSGGELAAVLENMGRPAPPRTVMRRCLQVAEARDRYRGAAEAVERSDAGYYAAKEEGPPDPEVDLYGGGLPQREDDLRCIDLLAALAHGRDWKKWAGRLRDGRRRVLAARLVAKHWPERADEETKAAWRAHVERCRRHGFGKRPSAAEFREELDAMYEAGRAAPPNEGDGEGTGNAAKDGGAGRVERDLEEYDREVLAPFRQVSEGA